MFRLATCDLRGRNVLLVESDHETASAVASSLIESGAKVTGFAATLPEAVKVASAIPIDVVVLHVRYVADSAIPIKDVFRPLGIDVEFIACFDDWFEFVEDGDDGDQRSMGVGVGFG